MINPVSVVISTRKIDEGFVDRTKKSFSHPKTQILIYENNGEFSLPQLYNKGMNESINDIVVFMHDDIDIETTNVTKKLNDLFDDFPEYGIIGLAGTNNMVSGMWWQIRESMQGQVKHEHQGKVHRNNYSGSFGDELKDVIVVDGLFFAVHKKRIVEGFDEEFPGFHFYDIPFCFANFLKGVKIGVTTKIMVIHKSIGMVNKQWEKSKWFFEAKYGQHLPVTV
jgi:hypothetical protein